MSWETVKLKQVCHLEKGNTGIMKAIPGEYPMVTMAEERKTHNEYQFDAKAIIVPMVSGSGHGKASINRIHYQEGKFAVGTILCAVIPKDHDVLEPLFLYHYCDVFKEELFVPLMRGMANVTLPLKALEELEIPLPSIDFQRKWVAKFEHISAKQTELRSELTHQQTLLTRLRQAILQEAVQGQLTAQWRQANHHQEPASELLRRIQAEKAATGKKEKPLPPVKAEEMPFELPEGWVWCRLDDICLQIVDCPHSTPNYLDFDTGFYAIDTTCINAKGEITKLRNVSEDTYLERITRLTPMENDIVYSREGSIGQSVILPKNMKACLGQRVMLFRLPHYISSNFIKNILDTDFYLNQVLANHKGMGAKHVNVKDIRQSLIPLPPLPEQTAIVAQVERLLGLVGQLEAEAAGQRVQAEGLLQAALREAMGA